MLYSKTNLEITSNIKISNKKKLPITDLNVQILKLILIFQNLQIIESFYLQRLQS